jgi:FixJ family two-component response regulator
MLSTKPMPTRPFVCVIDDDESIRESLVGLLGSEGMRASVYASAEAFLASDAAANAACLIVDVSMPAMTGPQLQDVLVAQGAAPPMIFISARADEVIRRRVMERGAAAYFVKPFDEDAFLAALRDVLDASQGRDG